MSHVLCLDESDPHKAITVGGFYAGAGDLSTITASWRYLKSEVFGIGPDSELKYTFNQKHPSRMELDTLGWPRNKLVPAMLDHIAGLPITILARTHVDERQKTGQRDFYPNALRWLIRRLANDVDPSAGPHWVLVDEPPVTGKIVGRVTSTALGAILADPAVAAFKQYEEMYELGEDFGPGYERGRPLKELGFAPTLVSARAKTCDALQMADVIAGAFRDFCEYNLNAGDGFTLPDQDLVDENIQRIIGKVRRSESGKISSYGLDIYAKKNPARDAVLAWADRLAVAGS